MVRSRKIQAVDYELSIYRLVQQIQQLHEPRRKYLLEDSVNVLFQNIIPEKHLKIGRCSNIEQNPVPINPRTLLGHEFEAHAGEQSRE